MWRSRRSHEVAKVRWLVVAVLLLAPAGCGTGIGVRRAGALPLWTDLKASFFEAGELSPRTQQTLRGLDLENQYRRYPEDVCATIHRLALEAPNPDYLFALAEMNYHLGTHAEKRRRGDAVSYYYLSAGYAYHYLLLGSDDVVKTGGPPSGFDAFTTFDPRFRLACDLYNAGLAKCIRAAQRVGRLDASQRLTLPTPDGEGFTLEVAHHGFAWRPEEFGELLLCADYEAFGLRNHYRTYGLGVPLIGIRAKAAAPAQCAPGHLFYPSEVSFPVTAFFRFGRSLADLQACRAGRLELYNPLAAQAVELRGRTIPLETDLTTPLAYFLEKTDLDDVGLLGFLRADRLRSRSGIYLFEPYQPGKIPVVMTHGLLSSPLTWAPLFNELRADPELRKHYQFWFYLYPTGNPYLLTAADLRGSLAKLRQEVDPQGRDAALSQMVFVGHSMGGLVSKLVTQDSGSEFWGLMSERSFEELKASDATRGELQRIFFFERDPGVRRVIFLGTPHRGSALSPSPLGWLADKLTRVPRKLRSIAREVITDNPGLWPSLGNDPRSPDLPSSIDLLRPGTPALELIAARTAPAAVQYHSIIGVILGEDERGTDGVVSYRSAHIDGAASELVIPAHHNNVHHHPRAVLEVKRILREHLEAVRGEDPRRNTKEHEERQNQR